MYGYDILIEDNLKPWLIEVNASPSLATTPEADRKLKMSVMESVFQIVVPPEWFDSRSFISASVFASCAARFSLSDVNA